jgi:integrase
MVKKEETGIPHVLICQFEGRDHLQLKVRLDNPRRYVFRSLGTSDFDRARREFAPLYADIIGNPDEFSRTNIIHISKLVDQFMDGEGHRVRRNEISEGTHKSKERTLYKGFLPYCVGHKLTRVMDADGTSFKHYGTWRMDVYGYEQSTVNTEIRHVKEFLVWCQRSKGHWKGEEWLVPTVNLRRGLKKQKNRAYTDEMVEEMTDYLLEKQQDKTETIHQRWLWKLFTQFFTLQMECGCRTAEFTHVQWKHCKIKGWNPERPESLLEVINDVHIPISKTGPRDIVFMSPALINLRKMYEDKGLTLTPEDYVFINTLNGKRLGPAGFNDKWKRMAEDLGYPPDYTLYSTRSVYISDRIIQGSPISLIAQNCGNSVRVIEQDYKDVILKLNTDPLVQRANNQEDGDSEYMPLV